MSILSLGNITGNQRGAYQLTEKARSAISDISKAADKSVPQTAEQDSTTVAAQRSQAKITSFREAAQGVAKDLAQVAFALRATEKVSGELGNLQTLAKKALENPLDEKALEKLNKAIKNSRNTIDFLAAKNTLPQTAEDEESDLPKLDAGSLLGKEAPITSKEDLQKFLGVVEKADKQVESLNADVRELMDGYESMSTYFEISLQNQLAAGAVFPQSTESSLLDALLGGSSQALAAQGNRLSPEIMNLI